MLTLPWKTGQKNILVLTNPLEEKQNAIRSRKLDRDHKPTFGYAPCHNRVGHTVAFPLYFWLWPEILEKKHNVPGEERGRVGVDINTLYITKDTINQNNALGGS